MRQIITAAAITAMVGTMAFGGAKIDIDDTSKIDIGFRVQPLVVITEMDRDGDGSFETDTDSIVRRGRLRLKATVTDDISAFIQTDMGSTADGAGRDWRVIDAWVAMKLAPLFQIIAGQNMAPSSRQNLTSSGALMCIDRPGINYKTLTWGTRSVYAFANGTFADADAGLRGDVDVRDMGLTLFGTKSVQDDIHLKYYLGAYDGIQKTTEDNPRLAARAQVNFGGTENGYYHLSTHLDESTTYSLGASVDQQSEVAYTDTGDADYLFWTVDGFIQKPLGKGHLTVEAAFQVLDLDDATMLDHDGDMETPGKDATQSQGEGYYVQTGYRMGQVQPWAGYERWDSDSDTDKGTYDMYRLGMTYFIKGHNANIKAGFERLESETNIGDTIEDTINSFVVGCYVTY